MPQNKLLLKACHLAPIRHIRSDADLVLLDDLRLLEKQKLPDSIRHLFNWPEIELYVTETRVMIFVRLNKSDW